MKDYNYIPRPEIEHHHHIRDLIESQDKRVQDRTYHRERIKDLEERDIEINKANNVDTKDFWCSQCNKDFKGQAVKQIEIDWNNNTQRIAYYKTKCFKGHWCIRLITDKHIDGFFIKSRFVNLDRGNHTRDILQSFESGYNLLYKK